MFSFGISSQIKQITFVSHPARAEGLVNMIRRGEGWARAEVRALLDYDAACPPKGGSAKAGDLMASSLPLLDRAHWQVSPLATLL